MENLKDQPPADKAKGSGGDVQSKGANGDSEETGGSEKQGNNARQESSDSAKKTGS